MTAVDFLHHEHPPTWAGVESVTLGTEGQRQTNYATQALHMEEAFNGLFDFSIASKAPSGEIILQSHKQMKATRCEMMYCGWCRRSQPRVAIWFCVAIGECGLA
ncbi:hypothetical protein TNCV_3450781 [Trichonephila clavipes]|uniref:Uncharacterized protein n=1 Tax=Trichonephila clavipes TaxID=2585209 RepID=A0A8X7BM76_TRICX|nr:hypothetical protein TNCV_3450781 [Trichonephila clavipes]